MEPRPPRADLGRRSRASGLQHVEDAFGLLSGLWGTLEARGLVQNATFAGGRKPPHATRRAWEITDRAGESLRQAEVLGDALTEGSSLRLTWPRRLD